MDVGAMMTIKPRKDRQYRQALVVADNQSKHVVRGI